MKKYLILCENQEAADKVNVEPLQAVEILDTLDVAPVAPVHPIL